MTIIYDIFFIIFAIFYVPFFLLKGKCDRDLLQRFAIYEKDLLKNISLSRPIWLHAVSVGEMKAAEGLLDRIRILFPSKRIVISNVTKTGHQLALSIAHKNEVVIYFPFDISFVVKKAIKSINPCLFIIIETEIWPNFIIELHNNKIPIALMNGRISQKSFRNYKRIKYMMRNILDKITLFAMRTEDDAFRIKELGADRDRVKVTGDMKFDIIHKSSSADDCEYAPIKNRKLWLSDKAKLIIAGSTHKGEDCKIIEAFKSAKAEFDELTLLLAPRHIERAGELAGLIEAAGLKPVKMSEIEKGKEGILNKNTVFILDSMGQLRPLYQLASIVFMGGSLVPKGGHNFAEPAVYAKPVITGPYLHNFQDMAELFKKESALLICQNAQELAESFKRLASDDRRRKIMGENARKVVLLNVGSTERNSLLLTDMVQCD